MDKLVDAYWEMRRTLQDALCLDTSWAWQNYEQATRDLEKVKAEALDEKEG